MKEDLLSSRIDPRDSSFYLPCDGIEDNPDLQCALAIAIDADCLLYILEADPIELPNSNDVTNGVPDM